MWQPLMNDHMWCMRPGIKTLSQTVRYTFITPLCPTKRLECYRVIILSVHISGMARSTDSLFGIVTNSNNKESKRMYLSPNASTLCIAFLLLGNLF